MIRIVHEYKLLSKGIYLNVLLNQGLKQFKIILDFSNEVIFAVMLLNCHNSIENNIAWLLERTLHLNFQSII